MIPKLAKENARQLNRGSCRKERQEKAPDKFPAKRICSKLHATPPYLVFNDVKKSRTLNLGCTHSERSTLPTRFALHWSSFAVPKRSVVRRWRRGAGGSRDSGWRGGGQ